MLFITYDENDGFFDHVPPPAVPSYNIDGTLAGASTLSLAGEYFSDPTGNFLNPADTISGTVRPWGMGARVPMFAISPWSRGGWVNSQVFDHTSLGMFLEQLFGVQVSNISPWHRAVSGDLTSAFNFAVPNTAALPVLPNMSNYAATDAAQAALRCRSRRHRAGAVSRAGHTAVARSALHTDCERVGQQSQHFTDVRKLRHPGRGFSRL